MTGLPPSISDAERLVLMHTLEGKNLVGVAREVGCAHTTIHYQRERLFRKLGVRNLVELGALAQSRGWLRAPA